MESSYHTFSPYGHTQDFVVDDKVVGMHYSDAKLKRYCARIFVKKTLPQALITNASLNNINVQHTMARQPLGNDALSEYTAWSDAYRFPDDLLGAGQKDLNETLGPLQKWTLRSREFRVDAHSIDALGEGSMLSMDFGYGKVKELEAFMPFAIFVAKNFIRAAETSRDYRDTREAIGDLERTEPREEDIDVLLSQVDAATNWVNGMWARVGNSVQGKLRFDEGTEPFSATLTCRWQDPLLEQFRIHLEGDLPSASVNARLEPQPEGLAGFLKSLRELKVGDESMDDAYLIHSDKSAQRFLWTHKSEINAMAALEPELFFGPERLNIHVTVPRARVLEIVELLLKLTRKSIAFRLGVGDVYDDTAPLI